MADFGGKGRPSILRPTSDGLWTFRFAVNTVDGPVMTEPSDQLGITWPGNFGQSGWSAYNVDVDFDGATDFLSTLAGSGTPNRLAVISQRRPPGATPNAADWEATAVTTLLTSQQGDLVKHIFFDQNGDGLPDVLRLRQGRKVPDLIINSGNGFAAPQPQMALSGTAGNVQLGAGTKVGDIADPGVRVLDFDHDGRQDLLLVDNGVARDSSMKSTPSRTQLAVLLSRGNGFEVKSLPIPVGMPADGPTTPGSPDIHNYRLSHVLDANGDGLPDIVQFSADAHALQLSVRTPQNPDALIGISDGMGKKTSVTYRPTTDPAVFTPGTACLTSQFCMTQTTAFPGGGWLVRSYRTDNGIAGGQNEVRCRYEDARLDAEGGGYLGFGKWTVEDVARRTTVVTTYDLETKRIINGLTDDGSIGPAQVYANIGLPSVRRTTITMDSGVREVTEGFTYEFVPTAGGWSYYSRPKQVTTVAGESGAGLGFTVRKYTYQDDGDGFTTKTTVATTTHTQQGDFGETQVSTFDNVPQNWLIGLERRRTVTSTSPSGGTDPRVTTFDPDLDTGFLSLITIEPGDTTNDRFLTIELTPNVFGEISTITRRDRLGNERAEIIDYDAHGVHPSGYTNAIGHVTTVAVDPGLGVATTVTDPNNVKTTFDYDAFGRPRRVNNPGGGGVSIRYARDIEPGSTADQERFVTRTTTTIDGGGELRTVTNRLGQEIRRESKNLDGSFSFATSAYNVLGLLDSVTRPARVGSAAGPVTKTRFDELGRLLARIRPEDGRNPNDAPVSSSTATAMYAGLAATSTDDFERTARTTTDILGRLVHSENDNDFGQPVGTDYTYGAFGALRFVSRSDGNVDVRHITEMAYDNLGRRTLIDDPDTGTRTTSYNAFGEVREEIDGNLNVSTYRRDALGRVFERTDKDGVTSFVWDTAPNGKGKLAETTSASGVRRQFFYDTAGRLNRELWTVGGQDFQLDYKFDSVGRLQTISYPSVSGFSRFVVKNVYDADSGELANVQNNSGGASFWKVNSTRPDGQIQQEAFGNKVVTDYTYSDVTGRIGAIKSTLPGTTPTTLRQWSYDYWQDGNLRRRSDVQANQNERFQYDALSRLKFWMTADAQGKAVLNGWMVQYDVDDFGNITRRNFIPGKTTGGSPQDAQFTPEPGSNRLAKSFLGDRYEYDGNGNQVTRPEESITYTAFDLPLHIGGLRNADFLYDASGIRARKKVTGGGTGTLETTYVAGLYERRATNDTTIDHVFYVRAGDRVVAQVVRRQGGAETKQFLHDDRLGSVDAVTDSAGKVIERTKHDPFGNRVDNFNVPTLPTALSSPAAKVRFGFTGHEQDDELGLVNMRGRIYDPRLGRFLTTDPLVSLPSFGQSYNRYSYVFNNPLGFVDPTGLVGEEVAPQRPVDGDYTGTPGYGTPCTQAEAEARGWIFWEGRCWDPQYLTGVNVTMDPPQSLRARQQPNLSRPGLTIPPIGGGPAPSSDPSGSGTPPAPAPAPTKAASCCGCGCGGGAGGVDQTARRDEARRAFRYGLLMDDLRDLGNGLKNAFLNAIPGYRMMGDARDTWQAGSYGMAVVLAAVSVVDAGLAVGTGGESSLVTRGAAEGLFYRFGESYETATRLGRQAAAAEQARIGVLKVEGLHGVSVTQTVPGVPAGSATRAAIEDAKFTLVHTPTAADPLHHTCILPKPVTPDIANAFNAVFGRSK